MFERGGGDGLGFVVRAGRVVVGHGVGGQVGRLGFHTL